MTSDYHRRYEALKARGRPFWPDVLVEDAVVAFAVFLVLLALATFAPPQLDARADPTNTAYVPRPEWYFLFLFQLLAYFPGQLEWLGAMAVPVAILLLLLFVPALDRARSRRPRARIAPLGAFSVVLLGAVALTVVAAVNTPPTLVSEEGRLLTAEEIVGRSLLRSNCVVCHSVRGQGGATGPALDSIGGRRDAVYVHSYIENPRAVDPAAQMPAMTPTLSHEQVEFITRYLMTLR